MLGGWGTSSGSACSERLGLLIEDFPALALPVPIKLAPEPRDTNRSAHSVSADGRTIDVFAGQNPLGCTKSQEARRGLGDYPLV
jgi:hypothetical protein